MPWLELRADLQKRITATPAEINETGAPRQRPICELGKAIIDYGEVSSRRPNGTGRPGPVAQQQ